jgi:hypothetical protein
LPDFIHTRIGSQNGFRLHSRPQLTFRDRLVITTLSTMIRPVTVGSSNKSPLLETASESSGHLSSVCCDCPCHRNSDSENILNIALPASRSGKWPPECAGNDQTFRLADVIHHRRPQTTAPGLSRESPQLSHSSKHSIFKVDHNKQSSGK